MERSVLEESIRIVAQAAKQLKGELEAIFTTAQRMTPSERLIKADILFGLASNLLPLEDEIYFLRMATEKAEDQKEFFLRKIA